MKSIFLSEFLLFFVAGAITISCKKAPIFIPALRSNPTDTTHVPSTTPPSATPPSTTVASCPNRPVVKVDLVPVGSLTIARSFMLAATAGSKILFAGGVAMGTYSSRVDIYDTITKNWSTAELSVTARQGMAVASLGSKIFFAGGVDADNGYPITSRVDIYDAAGNTWSTAELSYPRAYLTAIGMGNKVFFAGGGNWGATGFFTGLDRVDIYDVNTSSWTTTNLSEGRYELTATAVGGKIYFAGGIYNMYSISSTVDIYDTVSNNWTTSQLQQPRTGHVGISAGDKIFWAGGAMNSYQYGYSLYDNTEIRNVSTGLSSFECFTPKAGFSAVKKNDDIIFFPGSDNGVGSVPGDTLDVYNISSNSWSKGALPGKIRGAAIVSVNNEIYVAGGEINGSNTNQVSKLRF